MSKKLRSRDLFKQEQELFWEFEDRPDFLQRYQNLEDDWKERYLGFCLGERTLPVMYRPFFKAVFSPELHPERLSRLISSLLGKELRVVCAMPENKMVLAKDSMVLLNVLAEQEDGSLVDAELQRVPYTFPAERMSCYSADLMVRQYDFTRKTQGNHFKYGDVKKVYSILFFEKSERAFHAKGTPFVHRGKTVFDTGLKLELLQEYCLVSLDAFRKAGPIGHSESMGWLALLTVESMEEALSYAEEYPWLAEIYGELTEYMKDPEGTLEMFLEAMRNWARNDMQYQLEAQQLRIKRLESQLEERQSRLEASIRESDVLRRDLVRLRTGMVQRSVEKYILAKDMR